MGTKKTWLILIGGEDGGIGKSTFCSLMAQYCLALQQKFCLVDANRLKKDVKVKYEKEQYQKLISFEDIIFSESSKKDTDANLVYELAAEEGKNILVNLPAEIHQILVAWLKQNDILEMALEADVEIYYFHVSNGTKENLKAFEEALKSFEACKIFLVKNENKCQKWDLFAAAEERLQKTGGSSFVMPDLHKKYKDVIDENNLSWDEAKEYLDRDRGYRAIARNNVKKYLKNFYQTLDRLELFAVDRISALTEEVQSPQTPSSKTENRDFPAPSGAGDGNNSKRRGRPPKKDKKNAAFTEDNNAGTGDIANQTAQKDCDFSNPDRDPDDRAAILAGRGTNNLQATDEGKPA